jgi:hypothetical protein
MWIEMTAKVNYKKKFFPLFHIFKAWVSNSDCGETHINKIIKGEEGKGDYKELLRMRRNFRKQT